MAHYAISLLSVGPLPNKPLNLASAVSIAITELRQRGHQSIRLEFGEDLAVKIYGPTKALIGSIDSSLARPVGRPPTKHLVAEKPIKPFRFNGRPSATGWYRCRTLTELDMTATAALIGPKPAPWATYMVYMDREGTPLVVLPIPGVDAEAKRLVSSRPAGHGVALDRAAIGCQMALGHVLPKPPSEAVAVFVIAWDGRYHWYNVFGKRLVEGLPLVPYVASVSRLSTAQLKSSGGSGMSYEEGRAAYERQQAGLAPEPKGSRTNTSPRYEDAERGWGHVVGSSSSAKPRAKRTKK